MQKEFNHHSGILSYYVAGEGTSVVLLHGFAEDRHVWKYQVPELQKHCRLIIPDLPGSGKSALPEQLTMDSMADAVKAVLQQENISQAIMIGHSMGGYVTLAFAEKYPELLTAFGLFHSTAYTDSEEKKATRKKSIEFIQKHGSYEFLKQSSPNTFSNDFREKHPEKVEELINDNKNFNPEALITYYKAMMQRPDRTHVLKSFMKPVLFVIGKNDNAVPLDDSLRQCHLPVFSYIHILEASGHMGMWEEKGKANDLLLQFVKNEAIIP